LLGKDVLGTEHEPGTTWMERFLNATNSRHCERSEAIHSFFVSRAWIASSQGLLAMTLRELVLAPNSIRISDSGYTFAISRRDAPELCPKIFAPIRGRGECRMRAAPAVSRAKSVEISAHEHTGSAEDIRHSLRNGFTAYNALSPATNSSCHRHRRIWIV
jgi:hypothetical protein